MLVLSRKLDEEICINKDVYVKVIKIANGRVTLGFTAPREVSIVRTELLEQCPTCKVAMHKGTYDLVTVHVCPQCDFRKKDSTDGESSDKANQD
jgi:carbon storage regulator CsrA